MPRNNTGEYVLPQAAFVPGTTISSAAVNSDFSDIASALTESIATTGVSSMTGQLLAASGNVTSPGYSFSSGTNNGIYYSGTNQIGIATNGVQVGTFNSDQSTTWNGNASWSGLASFNGGSVLSGTTAFNSTVYTFGAGASTGFWNGIASNSAIEVAFDGGGSTLASGSFVSTEVPFNCTIQRVTALADQTGSVGVWLGLVSYSGYAGSGSFGSILSGNSYPTPVFSLSSAVKYQDSSLVNWNRTLTAGTILGIYISVTSTSITRLTVSLLIQRTGS